MISNLTRSAYNLASSLLENVKAIHIRALYRAQDRAGAGVSRRFRLAESANEVAVTLYEQAELAEIKQQELVRKTHAEVGRLLGDQ